jgi:hypothetical protein
MIIAYTILVGRPEGKKLFYERIILKFMIKKRVIRVWTEFTWLRIWSSGGTL